MEPRRAERDCIQQKCNQSKASEGRHDQARAAGELVRDILADSSRQQFEVLGDLDGLLQTTEVAAREGGERHQRVRPRACSIGTWGVVGC
jgi:hypothetical protein